MRLVYSWYTSGIRPVGVRYMLLPIFFAVIIVLKNTQPARGGLKCSELYVLGILPAVADRVFATLGFIPGSFHGIGLPSKAYRKIRLRRDKKVCGV